ncbi:NUDIX domain-containing protein [Pseudonocardia sp. HH130630-07]|uniref:NUDIX domain-containing protein n=1 Tax=Pseudonocardia sp. HH130630-07 TaxID=1690815 RepID=UPI0018D36B1E|nr:NUDIX domain-containing protein [Pseudonocardia sp. HH130630-07]
MDHLPRPVCGVGVVLERADGLVAVGHRVTAGETSSWSFPGGHLEGGETPVAAALRELAEETGVRAGTATLFALCVRTGGSGVTLAVHVPAPAGAELVVTEPHAIDAWVWADPDELPEPSFAHTAAVRHAWRTPGVPLPGWDLHRVAER